MNGVRKKGTAEVLLSDCKWRGREFVLPLYIWLNGGKLRLCDGLYVGGEQHFKCHLKQSSEAGHQM